MDVRNTYLVQFSNENIDSYYFRKELRLSAYLCKVSIINYLLLNSQIKQYIHQMTIVINFYFVFKDGDKTACERLSNMCALTLSEKSIPCKVSKSKQDPHSILWMFYEENGYPVVVNNKIVPVKYTLDKNDGVSINCRTISFYLKFF